MLGAAFVLAWLAEVPPEFLEEEAPILGEAVEVYEGGFSLRPPEGWERKEEGAIFLAPPTGRFRNTKQRMRISAVPVSSTGGSLKAMM